MIESIILLVVLFLVLISIVITTKKVGISPMPTSILVRKILKGHLPKAISGSIVDMGSGWGNMLKFFAKRYPNNQVIGYELSLVPYLISRVLLCKYPNVTIYFRDFLDRDKEGEGLVYTYLCPAQMKRVFRGNSKPLLISSTFRLPGVNFSNRLIVNDFYKTPIYFYR